jgi:hypothetical protein
VRRGTEASTSAGLRTGRARRGRLYKLINSHVTLSLMSKSEEGDGGEYICWAENRAGKAGTVE